MGNVCVHVCVWKSEREKEQREVRQERGKRPSCPPLWIRSLLEGGLSCFQKLRSRSWGYRSSAPPVLWKQSSNTHLSSHPPYLPSSLLSHPTSTSLSSAELTLASSTLTSRGHRFYITHHLLSPPSKWTTPLWRTLTTSHTSAHIFLQKLHLVC